MKLKVFIKLAFVLSALILFPGCSSPKEITEIKPVVIYPSIIEDTVKTILVTDSIITGVETGHSSPLQKDTTIIVKYFPKLQKFYIKAKPDSIIMFDTVRTTQIIEKNIETPFLSKMGLVMIGIIITIAGAFILRKRG